MISRTQCIRILAHLLATIAILSWHAIPGYADDTIPVVTIPGGQTMIDDIGWYGVSYRYTDGRTGSMPMGWTGHFEDATGISAIPAGTQNGKRAYLEHPIWRKGTGDTDQTYRLALPQATSVTLTFSIALGIQRGRQVRRSDIRAYVNGQKLLDQTVRQMMCGPMRVSILSPM